MNTNDIIEHHGVKGMKWGRRIAKGIKSWMIKQNEKYYDSHNGLLEATIVTSISLTTGLVFWAGVWIAKQVYWEIMGYK